MKEEKGQERRLWGSQKGQKEGVPKEKVTHLRKDWEGKVCRTVRRWKMGGVNKQRTENHLRMARNVGTGGEDIGLVEFKKHDKRPPRVIIL